MNAFALIPVACSLSLSMATSVGTDTLPGPLSLASVGAGTAIQVPREMSSASTHGPTWIRGAMAPASEPMSLACGTAGSTTGGETYLGCSDPQQIIRTIKFASFGNPSVCPNPTVGSCTHPDSRTVIEPNCVGQSNCTVALSDFGNSSDWPPRFADMRPTDPLIVMATARCSEPSAPLAPPERRANNLRLNFVLQAAPNRALATVSAIGYNVLYANGKRVSPSLLEPGRPTRKSTFYSTVDLCPCVSVSHSRCGYFKRRTMQFQLRVDGSHAHAQVLDQR